MISQQTATDIAYAYREIEMAEKLLVEITTALDHGREPDIRDDFGRWQGGLQLGVPRSRGGHTLFNVPWTLAKPVIEAHIVNQRGVVAALNEKAISEGLAEYPEASKDREKPSYLEQVETLANPNPCVPGSRDALVWEAAWRGRSLEDHMRQIALAAGPAKL